MRTQKVTIVYRSLITHIDDGYQTLVTIWIPVSLTASWELVTA